MSRSNPQTASANPAVRWFEWKGETGGLRYYDKATEANVDVPLPFTFLLLDQLGSVGGWHKAHDCRIWSNHVKDTRREPLVVKSAKSGIVAEGIYASIKDELAAVGGQFVAVCYIATRIDGELQIAVVRFKGKALSAWMDFCKEHRKALDTEAVVITGFETGKKGSKEYAYPVFALRAAADATNQIAVALDQQLQSYLNDYLTNTPTRQQVEQSHHVDDEEMVLEPVTVPPSPPQPAEITMDDIPF